MTRGIKQPDFSKAWNVENEVLDDHSSIKVLSRMRDRMGRYGLVTLIRREEIDRFWICPISMISSQAGVERRRLISTDAILNSFPLAQISRSG